MPHGHPVHVTVVFDERSECKELAQTPIFSVSPAKRLSRLLANSGNLEISCSGEPWSEFAWLRDHLDVESVDPGCPTERHLSGVAVPANLVCARDEFQRILCGDPHSRFLLLNTPSDHVAARELIYNDAVKNSREWLSVPHRRFAFLFSRAFLAINVSPNSVSILSLLVNLAGCVPLYFGYFGLATLVLWFSCVLDCADGAVARVQIACSNAGNRLDTMCDLVFHITVYACLGYSDGVSPFSLQIAGLHLVWHSATLAWISIAAITMIVGYTFLHRLKVVPHDTDKHCEWLRGASRRSDAKRTFVYLSYIAKRHTFPYVLAACLIGGYATEFLAASAALLGAGVPVTAALYKSLDAQGGQ